MELSCSDFAGAEKYRRSETALAEEAGDNGYAPRPGDMTFYIPMGTISLFYNDYPFPSGLIHIGTAESGLETIEETENGTIIRFEELDFER